MRKATNFQKIFSEIKKSSGRRTFRKKKGALRAGLLRFVRDFCACGNGGAQEFFASHFGGYASGAEHPCRLRREEGICKRCGAPLQASPRRGDMQAVRSTLAGFAEKGDMQAVRSTLAGFAEKGDMQAVRSTLAGFAEKRKPAFSRENNGRSLQSKPSRYHQYENFLQTPLLYVLSFLKRKYERKQFEGHIPSKTPLKVQGGTFPTRQLYQSKGGSAVRILKHF